MSVDFALIKGQFPLVDVAARYVQNFRKYGSEFRGLCPFHDDRNPSFYVFRSRDGYERYQCFACQEGGDVVDFISNIHGVSTVEACDILTNGQIPEIGEFKPQPSRDRTFDWQPIIPAPDDAPEFAPSRVYNPKRGQYVSWRPSLVTPYHDAEGRILCYVVRLDYHREDGSRAKTCITVTYCKGPDGEQAWAARRMEDNYPLLGLRELAQRKNDVVLIVSGEKCWHVAKEHMPTVVPVTWMGGDDAVGKIDYRPLVNRWRIYMNDNDESGERAMLKLHNLIERAERE
jgi:hypothetical protein